MKKKKEKRRLNTLKWEKRPLKCIFLGYKLKKKNRFVPPSANFLFATGEKIENGDLGNKNLKGRKLP